MGSYTKKKLVAQAQDGSSGGGGINVDTLYKAEIDITEAEILQLNSTPKQIIAAPGIGKYIEVVSASASIVIYSGTPYTVNTSLTLINTGATIRQSTNATFLGASVVKNSLFIQAGGIGATDTQCVNNAALNVSVLTGNPTNIGTGSDIKVKVLYRIVTI